MVNGSDSRQRDLGMKKKHCPKFRRRKIHIFKKTREKKTEAVGKVRRVKTEIH